MEYNFSKKEFAKKVIFMIDMLFETIETKRNSSSISWRMIVKTKDFFWKIKDDIQRNQSMFSFFLGWYYYVSLFFLKPKKGKRKEKIAAIVLSWKRTENLPFVIYGLRKQSLIDDIYVLHNFPSKRWMPGCKNIFYKTNEGCKVRHDFAATLKGYDYFIFSDDDLMLKRDIINVVEKRLRQFGKESVMGFYGHKLNLENNRRPYTSGSRKDEAILFQPIDIVKGRFHVISKKGIKAICQSDFNTPALISEDDIRANLVLQKKFKKPSYLFQNHGVFIELQAKYAREHRSIHNQYRDRAIQNAIKSGWSLIGGE